ncbi:MAG: DMT family transporter [Eubacteriales bacterium]|nr:DMT family transporter [Eubacteriales bacterium]
MGKNQNFKQYLALTAAVFFWSSAFVVSKKALTGLEPLTLSTLRIVFCFVLLLPFAIKRGFRFRDLFHKRSFFFGIVGYGGNMALVTLGLNSCSAGISAIAHGLFPVFMIFFGYSMLSEKVTLAKGIGVLFAVAGVVVATMGDLSSHSDSTLLGVSLVILSVFIWAWYSVTVKKKAFDLDAIVLTELGFGTAAITFIPLSLGELALTGLPSPDHVTLICIVYLSVMSGVFATVCWNAAVKKVPAVVSGVFFNLMPVIGLGFALVAGESSSWLKFVGCALVLLGVVFTTVERPQKNC